MKARRRARLLLFLVGVVAGGCGGGSPIMSGSGGHGSGGAGGAPGSGGETMDAPDETGVADGEQGGSGGAMNNDVGERCNVVVEQHTDDGAGHTQKICDPVTYATNPPSSGTHYPTWADYKIYDKPVPWGFLVHDLEHGAVVISYRCPTGCNVDLTDLRSFLAALPPDDVCLSRKLITVVPDPNLDVAFAASAWTWTLRADCFDAASFGDFIAQHYGHGLERVCSGGADLSSTGWCP